MSVLVRAAGPVTLVGAGPIGEGVLAAALALAPEAVAADGGGDVALPEGFRFRAVIGDMDSLRNREGLAAAGVAIHAIPEQETTDLEKCLRSVVAPLYLAVGFSGGRMDHALAAANALAANPGRRVVLIGPEDICLLMPNLFAIDLPAGTRVSLFPLAPVRGVVSEGLRWPVTGLRLAPDDRVGTSNRAEGGRVRVGFDRRKVLAILPLETLPAVARLLARW